VNAALRLVVILDRDAARGRDLAVVTSAAARGGATMLQVRAKGSSGRDLVDLTRCIIAAGAGLPVVVNDRLDVALAAGAAGAHLGQHDVPLADARRLVPPGFILGGSACDEREAREAARGGAHYLGIGPVNATANKADAGAAIGVAGFARVRAAGGLPAVGIGGLTAADVPALLAAGAAGVAVIGAVLLADDAESATRLLREALDRAVR
jgi:thiamine-phosphate pyrophosphorylase